MSSRAFNIFEHGTQACVWVCNVNSNYDVYIIDMNGVSRRVASSDPEPVYDGEVVRTVAKATPTKAVDTVYTVKRMAFGTVYDAIDILFAPPIRYWRKDRFYVKGDRENPSVGHILVSMS